MIVYLGKNPVGVGRIVEKKVAKEKFGVTVDNFIGNVDADGNYVAPKESFEVNFAGVKSVGSHGLEFAFYQKKQLISVNLSPLQSIGYFGLYNTFYGCSDIISANVSSVQSIGENGMYGTFYGCSKLTKLFFLSLKSINSTAFGISSSNFAFRNCSALTEIHFRADMQATIEAMSGYSSKWGATNATIFFDL